MNLQEFIDYRHQCPICGYASMTTKLGKRSRQIAKHEDGRLMFMFDMRGLKRGQPDYKAGVSFDKFDNTFYVEFFTEDSVKYYDQVPSHLLEKYRIMNSNIGSLPLRRECTACHNYEYNSPELQLDFKNQQVIGIGVYVEGFGLHVPFQDGYKNIALVNFGNHSEITVWNSQLPYTFSSPYYPTDSLKLTLPPIPFVSVEETTRRINALLPFS